MTGDLFDQAGLKKKKLAKRRGAVKAATETNSKKAKSKAKVKGKKLAAKAKPVPAAKTVKKPSKKPARSPAPKITSQKTTKGDRYSAKDIEVLEGLEPVRRRPGMYIGGTDECALHHLAAEGMDNAMDEAVAGHASRIDIHLAEDQTVTVADNGRGIPVDTHPKFKDKSALEVILTTLHSGGKFSGDVYEMSGGLHGVGLSVVNALADRLRVEVARDKTLWSQSFIRG